MQGIDEILQATNQVVTQEMNGFFDSPFDAEEIKLAIKQMHPLKAPSPDGLLALFYKKYWHIVDRDVT